MLIALLWIKAAVTYPQQLIAVFNRLGGYFKLFRGELAKPLRIISQQPPDYTLMDRLALFRVIKGKSMQPVFSKLVYPDHGASVP